MRANYAALKRISTNIKKYYAVKHSKEQLKTNKECVC